MSYNRRIEVDVVGRTSGFEAAMNRVNAGLTRMGSGLRGGRNETSLFSRQLMALGTTARYYLAGRLVFGVQSAIQSLGEFKSQLGDVDALASQLNRRGQLIGLGGQLADVGSEAILMSNKFGIAVGDVESYMQRFFSSFNPPGTAKQRVAEMTTYTNAILNLVSALGSEAGDPQKLAGGLTGLINAMPGGRQNPGKAAGTVADYFAVLLRQTPSLTGGDIATAAGRFASAASLAKMSVPEILSTFGVAAQTGGSPAVIIRGITQLLGQSLMHPTRPQSLNTYRAAGLPTDPNALAAMGGQKVLETLIKYVQEGSHGPGKHNANLDAIYNAFSRQESVRQFVNLLAQGGIPALRDFNKSLHQGVKENMAQQMAQRRLRQSSLVRMTQATHNLGISLVQGADWPLEHLVADPIIGVSNFAARHRTTTQGIVGGAVSLGAANALRRLGVFRGMGRFGKLGRLIGGASAIEQAAIGQAISKEELPAAISGGAADGSRANPYWVIISPLSWSVGSPGGLSQPVPNPGHTSTESKIAHSLWSRVKGFLPGSAAVAGLTSSGRAALGMAARGLIGVAPKVGGGVGLGYLMAMAFPENAGHGSRLGFGDYNLAGMFPHTNFNNLPVLKRLASGRNRDSAFGSSKAVSNVIGRLLDHDISPQRAEQLLEGALRRATQNNAIQVAGAAKLDVTVTTKHPDGTSSRTVKRGVPVKLWNAKQYPTKQGKPGSRKGN